MKFITMIGLAVVLALAVFVPANAVAKTYLGFQINIGNAPPPPQVGFRARPRMMLDPGTRVRVLAEQDPGYDMFQYGSWYYVSNNGYWYRGRSYNGPFTVIDARRVPRQMYNVPSEHWHHHPQGGPPGQMRRDNMHGQDPGQGHRRP